MPWGSFPPGGSRRESVSLPLLASRGHPQSLAHDPFFASYQPLCLLLHLLSDSARPPNKACYDYIRLNRIMQNNLPLSRSLIIPAKSLLPCEVSHSKAPGIGMWTSLGASGVDIILPTIGVKKAHLTEEVIFKLKTQHKSGMRSVEAARAKSLRGRELFKPKHWRDPQCGGT